MKEEEMVEQGIRRFAALLLAFATVAGPRAAQAEVTFSEEVAPILWKNCSECHREGQSAPFSLITFEDARKHAAQMLKMIDKGEMPPWLPGEKSLAMVGERGLSDAEIELLREWIEGERLEGAPLGEESLPVFEEEDWRLGTPDLVLKLERPWTLAAEGKDVFRNFVISNPIEEERFIRAVEYRIGNPKVVHHAVLQIDGGDSCRILDEADEEIGFGGMRMGDSRPPDGYFLAWSPGKTPNVAPEGMAWTLRPGEDFVLQLHLLPSGKPEEVAPEIGLHFTEVAPVARPLAFYLREEAIDIPAGEDSYRVQQEFVLPVDVGVLGFYPHAHYVCRSMAVKARLPDGTVATLLDIPRWDFDWQDLYTLEKPAVLPAETRIVMDYVYDNSAANSDNPFSPPQRIRSGNSSLDEMGTLWVQVLPLRAAGDAEFAVAQNRYAAESRPSTRNFYNYGLDLQAKGRVDEAIDLYEKAVALTPGHASSHYQMALALLGKGRNAEAFEAILRAVKYHPDDAKYRFKLGEFYAARKEYAQAEAEFAKVLELAPGYPFAEEFREAAAKLVTSGGDEGAP